MNGESCFFFKATEATDNDFIPTLCLSKWQLGPQGLDFVEVNKLTVSLIGDPDFGTVTNMGFPFDAVTRTGSRNVLLIVLCSGSRITEYGPLSYL